MSAVAALQDDSPQLAYVRVPLREESDARALVTLLSGGGVNSAQHHGLGGRKAFGAEEVPHAYHLDVGHIIPEAANVLLFELMVRGAMGWAGAGSVFRFPRFVFQKAGWIRFLY